MHPLTLLALLAIPAFLWGLLASLGANLGYRRDLEWQTAFVLGLIFSGLWLAIYYSIRPLARTTPVEIPRWISKMAKLPSLLSLGAALLLSIVMEVNAYISHVSAVNAPWLGFSTVGLAIAALATIFFTALGGFLGASWYNQKFSFNLRTSGKSSRSKPSDLLG